MEQMEQCLECSHRLFFKPLPDETFTCCFAHGERALDINIRTGVSPAIKKHRLENKPCGKFSRGESVFEAPVAKPFLIHPARKDGEEYLLKILTSSISKEITLY